MCDYLLIRLLLALRPRDILWIRSRKCFLLMRTMYGQEQVQPVESNLSMSGVPCARRHCLLQKQITKRAFLHRRESIPRPAHFPSRYLHHHASVHGDTLPGKKLLILSNSAPRSSTTGCFRPYTVMPILIALSSSCIASSAYSQGSRGAKPFGGFFSERRRFAK